jgi:LPS export ABC transporter protein LptC
MVGIRGAFSFRWRAYWLAKVGLFLCLLGGGGCGETEETTKVNTGRVIPDQQFYDYRLIETKQGIKQWILASQKMLKYADQEEVELITVDMQFFREGEYFSTLTADSGRANLSSKNLFAWGDVEVVTTDGRRLETEELHYDNARELIYNDVFCRFTRGEDLMTGVGLEASPDLEYFELKEQVKAEVGDEGQDRSENR